MTTSCRISPHVRGFLSEDPTWYIGSSFVLKFKAVATMMVATTTSTGTVSPIFFVFPLSYLTIPNPTNRKRAAAAAILSIQPGKG